MKYLFSPKYLPRRAQRDFIQNEVEERKFNTVADLGAGKQPYRKHIKCKKYYALDIENRGAQDFVKTDLNEGIPLANESTDLVICVETLEHVKYPHKTVAEIFRIMKSGGTLLISAPLTWRVHEKPNDYYRFTEYGLNLILFDAGFSGIRIQRSCGTAYTICALICAELKNPIFKPLVFLLNVTGYLLSKKRDGDLTIDYQVVARKP